jgi:hypothetical protein
MGASGYAGLAVIICLCVLALLILPKGFTGITMGTIVDDGITFENPSPVKSAEIFGECYQTKLTVDYHFECSLCNPKDIREYFWFRNANDNEFNFLKGDRKTIKSGREYTAEMTVDVCKGNSYEWYFCIDDTTLKCTGKEKNFKFKVV